MDPGRHRTDWGELQPSLARMLALSLPGMLHWLGICMYAIVKFIDESDAPGIVCTHWICSDENLCRYPNVRTNEARDKLLRKLAEPARDWISCRIKILHKYSTFSEATLHLPMAEETSNLDSGDESFEPRPRKKFRRCYTYQEQESDEDSGPPVQKRKVSQKTCEEIDPYPNPYDSSPIPPRNIQIQSDVTQLENTQTMPQASSSPLSFSKKQPACSSSQTVINAKLVAWMADISAKVQHIDDKLDLVLKNQALLLKNRQMTETLDDRHEDFEILDSLPLTDNSSFVELNKRIAEDSHIRHLLVKVLISVGGKDMRCHIHNMLRRIISDDVAELYTLSGKSTFKNTVKKAFLTTEISKAIFVACQRVYKEMATEVKMKEAVGDWLNQAKVRKSRRMQRQEKNITNVE